MFCPHPPCLLNGPHSPKIERSAVIMPLPPLRVFNGLQRGGGGGAHKVDRGYPLSLHGPTPSSPFPTGPAAEDPLFPTSSKSRKGQGASAPRPHPPPRNCSGTRTHTHTHTQAREARLSVAHPRPHSPPAPPETRWHRSPGPVSGTGHARNFVRTVATLPEAHARTLHAGSQE